MMVNTQPIKLVPGGLMSLSTDSIAKVNTL